MKFSLLYKCIKLDVVATIEFKILLLLKNVTKETKGKNKTAVKFRFSRFPSSTRLHYSDA